MAFFRRFLSLILIGTLLLDPLARAQALPLARFPHSYIPPCMTVSALNPRSFQFRLFDHWFLHWSRQRSHALHELVSATPRGFSQWNRIPGWVSRNRAWVTLGVGLVAAAAHILWPFMGWGHSPGGSHVSLLQAAMGAFWIPRGQGQEEPVPEVAAVCQDPSSAAFTQMTADIDRQIRSLRKKITPEERADLSMAEEVDRAQGLDATVADRERSQIEEFLKTYTSKSISIYFLVPPDDQLFFRANGKYAAAHYNPETHNIYLSWPLIETIQEQGLQDPQKAIQALACHALAHIIGMTHDEAVLLHSDISPELDGVLEQLFQQQRDSEPSASNGNGDNLDVALSTQDKRRVRALTSDIVVNDPTIPEEWLRSYRQIRRERKDPLDGPPWFADAIRRNSRVSPERWEKDPQAALKEALQEWELRLVYFPYPNKLAVCSYNDDMDWGYNFVHPSGVRIQVGPNEFEWTPWAKQRLKNDLEEKHFKINSQWPYLQRDLWILRQPDNVQALLTSGRLTAEEKAALKGFAYIAATISECLYRIDLYQQTVTYRDGEETRTLRLSPELLAGLLGEAERLAREDGKVRLPRRQVKMTPRQWLRLRIARATAEAQKDIASTWNRIAHEYLLDMRNGASFVIKRGAVGQIFHGLIHWMFDRPLTGTEFDWLSGDPLPAAAVHRILSLGGATEVLPQALDDLEPALTELGIRRDAVKTFNLDFAEQMLIEGRSALHQLSEATGRSYKAHQIAGNAVNGFLPFRDGAFDMVETGNFGSIGEGVVSNPGFRHHGMSRKIHLLIEMRRVLRDGGYAVFTVRNKMPDDLYDVLPLFGMRVISQRGPELSFTPETLDLLTAGDPVKRRRLQTILRSASYVVAYRDPRLVPLPVDQLMENPGVQRALEYKDSYRTGAHLDIVRTAVPAPEGVDISDLRYHDLHAPHLKPAAIGRHILETDEAFKDFIPYLRRLQWARGLMGPGDQAELDELLRLWDKEKAVLIPDHFVDFVYGRITRGPRRIVVRTGRGHRKREDAEESAEETPDTNGDPTAERTHRVSKITLLSLSNQENNNRAAQGQPTIEEELNADGAEVPAAWAAQSMNLAIDALKRLARGKADLVTPEVILELVGNGNPTPKAIAETMQRRIHISPPADRIIEILQAAGLIEAQEKAGQISRAGVQRLANFIQTSLQKESVDMNDWLDLSERFTSSGIALPPALQSAVTQMSDEFPKLSWPSRCQVIFNFVRMTNDLMLRRSGFLLQAAAESKPGPV